MSFAFAPSDSSTGLTDFVELADRSAPMRPLPTDQSLEVLRKITAQLTTTEAIHPSIPFTQETKL
jgi:hypothetical protein